MAFAAWWLLLFFLSPSNQHALPTNAAAHAPADDICRQTGSPDICKQVLSLSHSSGDAADAKALSRIVVHAAVSSAAEASSYVAKLHRKAKDELTRTLLRYCNWLYVDVVQKLQAVLDEDLNGHSYKEASRRVMLPLQDVVSCHANFVAFLLRFPEDLAIREQDLKELVYVAADVIKFI